MDLLVAVSGGHLGKARDHISRRVHRADTVPLARAVRVAKREEVAHDVGMAHGAACDEHELSRLERREAILRRLARAVSASAASATSAAWPVIEGETPPVSAVGTVCFHIIRDLETMHD